MVSKIWWHGHGTKCKNICEIPLWLFSEAEMGIARRKLYRKLTHCQNCRLLRPSTPGRCHWSCFLVRQWSLHLSLKNSSTVSFDLAWVSVRTKWFLRMSPEKYLSLKSPYKTLALTVLPAWRLRSMDPSLGTSRFLIMRLLQLEAAFNAEYEETVQPCALTPWRETNNALIANDRYWFTIPICFYKGVSMSRKAKWKWLRDAFTLPCLEVRTWVSENILRMYRRTICNHCPNWWYESGSKVMDLFSSGTTFEIFRTT